MWKRLGLLAGSGELKVDDVREVSVVILLKNAVVGVVMVVAVAGFVIVVEVCLVALFVAGLFVAVAAVLVAAIVGEAGGSGGMYRCCC